MREREFLSSFPRIFKRLQSMKRLNPVLIYLEASTSALVRRFSETRRPHPLAPGKSASEGIRTEQGRMAPIRALASEIVDTSDMTVHELRQFFMRLSRDRSRAALVITMLSFGKSTVFRSMPISCSTFAACRTHFVPTCTAPGETGLSPSSWTVSRRRASSSPGSRQYLRYVLPRYVAEGKSYLTMAIGCTGGRHRSVMIAERLGRALANVAGTRIRVRHRDIQHS